MPVKLVGRKVTYSGKTLWEILGNLKNFGVGRLVLKHHFFNYPEPSYYKIVKVQPVMAPSGKYENRRVMIWAEHVFRGNKYPNLVEEHFYTSKTMFQLVPRSEEHKYLNDKRESRVTTIPSMREWPPVMKILLDRDAKRRGKSIGPLQTVISTKESSFAEIKDDGTVLKTRRPQLHMGQTVEQLTQKLQELKATSAESSTT